MIELFKIIKGINMCFSCRFYGIIRGFLLRLGVTISNFFNVIVTMIEGNSTLLTG